MGHPVQPGDPLECQGLSSKAGAIGVMRPTEAGDLRFAPLARIRTHRMRARSGLYRWYNDYRLPEHLGGGQITVGLHHDDEDRKRRFNRTENRPADPALGSGLRPSLRPAKRLRVAEPGPAGHPVLRRPHSLGWRRQQVEVLGWALMVNALTMARHRAAGALEAAA